ncbi:unnamed protein product [Symbiodinium sp. CCMP2592]|nr:unnamed protein product [Symbiodinium sp. CCMP2592]
MHTPPSRRWQSAETPELWKLQREGSASRNQMPAASVQTPVHEEVQADAPDSESSSSSCTSRPSPTDTAKKKKTKSKKKKYDRRRSSSNSCASGKSPARSRTPTRSNKQKALSAGLKDTPPKSPKLREVLTGSGQQGSGKPDEPDVGHPMATADDRGWESGLSGSSQQTMPTAWRQTSVDEAGEVATHESMSPSPSRTSSPSPPLPGSSSFKDELEVRLPGSIDTASKWKKKTHKPKKHRDRSKAPGFDLTKNPGQEKNVVVGFMQRLKHAQHGNNSLHHLGICYNTVEVKQGDDNCHQSTLTITAEDRDGAPYAWSGQEFRGEVMRKKAAAENAAARAFLADAAVQRAAANMDPPNEKQLSHNQKQRFVVLKELKRAQKAAKAAARQRRPCICKHVRGP